ncbi:hypothetical protein [Lelliottia sp. WAP21]|uniref:hypothetical protein n=1 Tax=Lelliottia sp. WAP21 TaxID=2877426 RepID=UPI001E564C7E|nr:hypothetical protein [Lelliottia sp. WAP21]
MQDTPSGSSPKRINGAIGALLGFLGSLFITYLWIQYELIRVDGDAWRVLGIGMTGVISIPFITLAGLVVGLLEQRCVYGPLLRGFTLLLLGICVVLGVSIILQDREKARLYGGPDARMVAFDTRAGQDDITHAVLTPVDSPASWICDVKRVEPDFIPERRDGDYCWLKDRLPAWQPGLKFQLSVRWYREKEGVQDKTFQVLMPSYENNNGLFFVIVFRPDNAVCINTAYETESSFVLKPASESVCSVMPNET